MAGRAWAPSPSRWTAAAAMAARRWPPASTPRARSSIWSRPDLTLEPGRDPIEMHGRRAARQQVLAEIEAGCVSRRRADQLAADHDHRVGAAVIGLAAELLQPLGDVHGVADEGVIDATGRADIADQRRAAVDADADADRLQPLAGTAGVV